MRDPSVMQYGHRVAQTGREVNPSGPVQPLQAPIPLGPLPQIALNLQWRRQKVRCQLQLHIDQRQDDVATGIARPQEVMHRQFALQATQSALFDGELVGAWRMVARVNGSEDLAASTAANRPQKRPLRSAGHRTGDPRHLRRRCRSRFGAIAAAHRQQIAVTMNQANSITGFIPEATT